MNIHEQRSGDWSPGLTAGERETLFRIVLDTLHRCTGSGGGDVEVNRYVITAPLRIARATFVTLHKQGRLRGCIGTLAPEAPLYRSVHDNAIGAALHDPRFPPVSPPELPRLRVDVSILGPIRPVPDPSAFKIGEHGIILEKGFHRAVYLPEVAVEQGWTVEETLCSLSLKAGLPPDGWRAGASFSAFASVVLSLEDAGGS